MCFKPYQPPATTTPKSHKSSRRNTSKSLGELNSSSIPSKSTEGTSSSNKISTGSSKSSTSSSLASVKETLLPRNPNLYNLSEITGATSNFTTHKLGPSTWKCTLRGKMVVVALRKVQKHMTQEDFRRKLKTVASAHHGNLVPVVGACYDAERAAVYLVYEYQVGSSLSDCLHGGRVKVYTVLDTWMSRMQVAVDVAQGLEYLHHDTCFNCIHNFMRSSSVLVTEPAFRAKLCHVGACYLSGEYEEEKVREISRNSHEKMEIFSIERSASFRISGTQGYMAPEMKTSGLMSKAGDVYAFGVVLLELLTGHEPVRFEDVKGRRPKRISLVDTVGDVLGGEKEGFGRLRRWADPRLRDSFPVDCAERVATVAAMCVQAEPERRPDMRAVAGEISHLFILSEQWAEQMAINKPSISTSIAFQGR